MYEILIYGLIIYRSRRNVNISFLLLIYFLHFEQMGAFFIIFHFSA